MSQTYLHSDNFELCRICLLEPEENRNVKFTKIFPDDDVEDSTLQQQIEDIYGIKIENDAIKPKIICNNCENALYGWVEMKKRSAESAIVIDYLAKSKATPPVTSNARSNSSLNSNNEEKPTMVKLEKNRAELPIEKKNNEIKFECKTRNKRNTKLPSTY
ncbi:hypothetical protein QTP88_011486 [Uroleucon formosanum]